MTLVSANGATLGTLGESEVMRSLKAEGAPHDPKVAPINQRQLEKELAHQATIRDVVEIAHLKASQAANHLAKQLPGHVENLVRAMISEAMVAMVQMLEERYVLTPREQPEQEADALPVLEIPNGGYQRRPEFDAERIAERRSNA